VVKDIIAQESKGLFDYTNGRLQKAFPFKSSFRDLFLLDHQEDQLLDKALALLFHHAPLEVSDAFFRLFEDGASGTLDLKETFEAGLPAKNATKEVGIYLRYLEGVSSLVSVC
jgi:hypothetical protein